MIICFMEDFRLFCHMIPWKTRQAIWILFLQKYTFKDIIERYRIEKPEILLQIMDTICSQTGSLTNISNIANAVNSINKNRIAERVSNSTIASYLRYLKDSFLFSEARCYDIRGKSYLENAAKYYPADTGLRNARLNFRQIEPTHLMDNAIYNYLKCKGFRVAVGVIIRNRTDKTGKHIRVPYEIDFCRQ